MRRHVYEKQIRAGRMSREQADRQIDLMEAIVRRLTRTATVTEPAMERIMVLIIVELGTVFLARAALDTALAVPRIAAEAEERAGW